MPYRKIDRSSFVHLQQAHWRPQAIAETMHCDRSTCYRWEKRLYMYGQPTLPYPIRPGPNRKIHEAAKESVAEYMKQFPCAYQDEVELLLKEEWDIDISRQLAGNCLKELSPSRQKGQRIGPQSLLLREIWQAEMTHLRAEQLVFFDQSNFKEQSCWRMMAYGPMGSPVRYRADINRGDTWSLMPAYTTEGYLPCIALKKGYYTTEDILEWLTNELLPHCNAFPGPRSVICMDNVSIHCDPRIGQAILAKGCLLKYLPPYSPDYNPIELTFSMLKAWMRRHFLQYKDAFRRDFGGFIRFAIEQSGRDLKAKEHFRYSPAGYQFEGDSEAYMEVLRQYECGQV